MLKRVFSYLILTALLLDLTGCATLQKHNFVKKRQTEYLKSQAAAPLRVPAGLDADGVGDDYLVPASPVPVPAKPIGLLPPDSLADKIARGAVTKQAIKDANQIADAKTTPVIATGSNQQAASILPVNNNRLPLNKTNAQAWLPVGKALKRMGYKIAVADEKAATYYILDLHVTDERVTKATPIYQVKLQNGPDDMAYAYIMDQNGNAVNAETSQRILMDLSNGLAGKSASSFSQMMAPVIQWFKAVF